MNIKQDEKYINQCLKLALKGIGKVSPNPLVGSVIVKNGRKISEGWHAAFGKDHAEAMAIKNAGDDISGATLYCNLEPCIHTNKKTPPCFPLIVQAGIKKVVIANQDPNPNVSGKSIAQMKKAGIEVVTGVLEKKGRELNRFFFKHIKQKKPWITLKIAQSIDGKISSDFTRQTWLTGPESKKYVHRLRAEYDAVLVGSNTINVDDPQLNVRETKGRNPLKILLSARFKVNPELKIFQLADKESLWIFSDEKIIQKSRLVLNKAVRVIGCPVNEKGQIELSYVLDFLYHENIGSVLVEGGQNIFSQFLREKLCDELIIIQAPIVLGNGLQSVKLTSVQQFGLEFVKQLGNDCCLNLRKKEAN